MTLNQIPKNNNSFMNNLKIKFLEFKSNLKFKKANNNNNCNSKNNKSNINTKDKIGEKDKKRIVVIKKQKATKSIQKVDSENLEFSLVSLNGKKSEEKNMEVNIKNVVDDKKDIIFGNNEEIININDKINIDNNLKIFEVISDAKVKSILEYEKEKNNIKLLKENFNMNNENKHEDIYNNKYLDDNEDYNFIVKKISSKDTFSFRPTNNDSREISEQDLKNKNDQPKNNIYNNNKNIIINIEEHQIRNEKEHRIKIIKKKKNKDK